MRLFNLLLRELDHLAAEHELIVALGTGQSMRGSDEYEAREAARKLVDLAYPGI